MDLVFFPNQNKNSRYSHIGLVIIEDNCEIGCGSTIDRGSMSNTIIGKNTYLDNQIQLLIMLELEIIQSSLDK
jgi:UDP-3-O-[3-hydroxymyristoyl] glucosamine N-acyltransferase